MVRLKLSTKFYYFNLDEVVYEINNGSLPPIGRRHEDIKIPKKHITGKSIKNLVSRNKDKLSSFIVRTEKGAFLYATAGVDIIWKLSLIASSNQKNTIQLLKNEQLIRKSWSKKKNRLIERNYLVNNLLWEAEVGKYLQSMERIECRINLYESIFDNLLSYDTLADDFNFYIDNLLVQYNYKNMESYISIGELKQAIKNCIIIILMISSSKSRNGHDFQSFYKLFTQLGVSSIVINSLLSERGTLRQNRIFSILTNELLLNKELQEAKSVKKELLAVLKQGKYETSLDSVDWIEQEYHVLEKALRYYYDTSIKYRCHELINKYRDCYKKYSYVAELNT